MAHQYSILNQGLMRPSTQHLRHAYQSQSPIDQLKHRPRLSLLRESPRTQMQRWR